MIKIGTRGSPLALTQAKIVKQELVSQLGLSESEINIVPITTTGDKLTNERLIDLGGKGLFTKEIEEALLSKEIDIAVHSMKDVETQLPEGLIIPCCLEREDVRDVWISPMAKHPRDLPPGSKVGTASLRRGAQILYMNPQVEIVTFRGNVDTRISKLNDGLANGTILALAGLKRLKLDHVATTIMDLDEMLPAPAQGALGLQCREDDSRMIALLQRLNHDATKYCVDIERAFLKHLDGSCRTPIAALAVLTEDKCSFRGFISDPAGKKVVTKALEAERTQMMSLVTALAQAWHEEYGDMMLANT